MMTLETLQARFRLQMKHKAGLLFEVVHNKVNGTPFKLAMSNLATTLTSWAKDLNLDVPRGTKGDRVNHLALLQGMDHGSEDNDVNFVGLIDSASSATYRVTLHMTANSLSTSSWPPALPNSTPTLAAPP
jgi:hypothetical protein